MLRLAVPFVLAAVLTGCSSQQPGTPSAGDQTGAAPTTGSSAGTAPVDRPKAVDMKTLDPCSLVTPETKAALAIRTVQSAPVDADYGEGSKACGTSFEDRNFTWGIHTVVNGGVDRLKRTVGKESQLTELKVAGYPAYLAKGESGAGSPQCEIYFDAHDEQLLLVSVIAGWGSSATADSACEKVKPLAEAAGAVLAKK
ncbi:DUF3558 domain-containing protein [Lentzea sp. BCCO 10_0856]|uniref:DUF3558 domain-containing protein n=1 Tax=Lentzea miocenica TaxID=3095431 RepID=A0ABU4SVU3_9PSEU|nr:DUF3558 domain-containing protein [Lentzea sp. BCCO 10_0856]MDX8030026.1 DUF3558 domain-containing protein [Lentzea sp. BCCO 10_0856]